MKKRLSAALYFLLLGLFVFPSHAHAYLDPGTGSYVLQMVAAALFGGAFIFKTWWKEIRSFVSRITSRKGVSESEKSPRRKK
ncbi:MAG: hypothetical protein RLZZ455_1031 [Candidatus Parcubacteria bacterium]|jgi:hypothetical protein